MNKKLCKTGTNEHQLPLYFDQDVGEQIKDVSIPSEKVAKESSTESPKAMVKIVKELISTVRMLHTDHQAALLEALQDKSLQQDLDAVEFILWVNRQQRKQN